MNNIIYNRHTYSIISMVSYTVNDFPPPLRYYVSVGVTWKSELWCSSFEYSINILMLHCVKKREREPQKSQSVSMTTSAGGGRSLTSSPLVGSILVNVSITLPRLSRVIVYIKAGASCCYCMRHQ